MRFILDLWPDEDLSPEEMVRWAIRCVNENPDEIRWDILDDKGYPVALDVKAAQ